jgi:hypothetical protein
MLPQVGLNRSGFAMAEHLLGVRLADIDNRPAFEVMAARA